MKSSRALSALIATGLVLAASPAFAHPKLLSSTPAAKATVSNVSQVTLTFSEGLVAPVSGAELTMTSMPGMADHSMKIAGMKTSVGKDGKTLVAVFAKPLPAGTYQLDWHVVSTDTHHVKGMLAFTVR